MFLALSFHLHHAIAAGCYIASNSHRIFVIYPLDFDTNEKNNNNNIKSLEQADND